MTAPFGPDPTSHRDSQRPEHAHVEPPLFDPYLGRTPPKAPQLPLSPAALTAALLALLPLGSVAAVPIGAIGLRQVRGGAVRGRWLAIGAMALGCLSTVAYTGGVAWGAVTWIDEQRTEGRRDEEKRERRVRERAALNEESEEKDVVPAPHLERVTPPDPRPQGSVPQVTETHEIGRVSVVQIGVKEPSLRAALIREMTTARGQGQEVMVMTTRSSCDPCDGVLKSIADSRMEQALLKTRLVVVDIDVFKDDLDKLHIQIDRMPGFFLLAADATPRDAIDGGEWGLDIAENIAPVLGPFVRGDLKRRKTEFHPAPGGGTFL